MATERDKEAFHYINLLLTSGVIGIDIGGTAGKVAFLQDESLGNGEFRAKKEWGETGMTAVGLELESKVLGGRVHFLKWATHRVGQFCDRILTENSKKRELSPRKARHALYATGGGAHKFEGLISETLGLSYHKVAEFDSLVIGFRYLTMHHPDTIYTVKNGEIRYSDKGEFDPVRDYPCAICNIGSGVSVLKVEANGDFERLGGTSIGGSTFLGLCKLLTGAKTFEEAISLASQGDSTKVDITIRDIYGDEVDDLLGLPGDIAASSFGKLIPTPHPPHAPADLASSLLDMVTQAIMQIASGFSARSGCKSLFFTGGFLRDNLPSVNKIAYFCELVGEKALFLKHSEFAGAIGCLCKAVERKKGMASGLPESSL